MASLPEVFTARSVIRICTQTFASRCPVETIHEKSRLGLHDNLTVTPRTCSLIRADMHVNARHATVIVLVQHLYATCYTVRAKRNDCWEAECCSIDIRVWLRLRTVHLTSSFGAAGVVAALSASPSGPTVGGSRHQRPRSSTHASRGKSAKEIFPAHGTPGASFPHFSSAPFSQYREKYPTKTLRSNPVDCFQAAIHTRSMTQRLRDGPPRSGALR